MSSNRLLCTKLYFNYIIGEEQHCPFPRSSNRHLNPPLQKDFISTRELIGHHAPEIFVLR